MIGVDTYIVVLEIEGILAELDMFELVFVEVWPTPQSSVDDMRKAFSPCYLQRYTNGGGCYCYDKVHGEENQQEETQQVCNCKGNGVAGMKRRAAKGMCHNKNISLSHSEYPDSHKEKELSVKGTKGYKPTKYGW